MNKFLVSILLLSLLSVAFSRRKNPYIVYPTEEKIIYDICFSKNGRTLVVADGNEIKWFSSDNRQLLSTFSNGHKKSILTIDLSNDSTLLVSGGKDSAIVIWDVMNKVKVKHLTYHKGMVTTVRLSTDNHYLFSGDTDNKVYFYDLKKDSLARIFSDHTDDITSIDVSPDGKLIVSGSADGTINFYDIDDKKLIASIIDRKRWIREVSFSKKGDRIITCGDDSNVITWQISDTKNIKKISRKKIDNNWILSAKFFDEDKGYATGGLNGIIRISTRFGNYKAKIKYPISKLLFKPSEGDNVKIAMATRGNGVLLMDAKDMHVTK